MEFSLKCNVIVYVKSLAIFKKMINNFNVNVTSENIDHSTIVGVQEVDVSQLTGCSIHQCNSPVFAVKCNFLPSFFLLNIS